MNLLLFLVTASLPAAEAEVHEKANPLYRQLRRQGIALAGNQNLRLPAPAMPDGLEGTVQQATIKKLLGDDIDIDNFLRDAVTAPQLLRRPDEKKGGPATPVRSLDLYFIAYGTLDSLADKAVLEGMAASERRPVQPRVLTPEELKLRGIAIPREASKYEDFAYVQANILVRVQVRGVGHSFWSRSPDSLVAATELDERFAKDPQFPNQWRSLIKEGEDDVKEGPAHPYCGAAYYVKITRLKEPAGALFVEAHVVFTEPVKWFDGENVLRSKLPAATMSLVRNFRRELARIQKK